MLNGTADANSNVELGSDNLSSLSDLQVIWHKTSVHGSSGSTHSRVHGVGKIVQDLEILTIAHATSAAHDNTRGIQRRPVRLGQLLTHERARVVFGRLDAQLGHFGLTRARLGCLECRTTNAKDFYRIFRLF